MAFVQSVAAPSETAIFFVNNQNALIDETSALYNQRVGAAKSGKKPRGNDRPDILWKRTAPWTKKWILDAICLGLILWFK